MEIKMKPRYEGMGFVEALIAIMVVGASSIVLMQIATKTLQDMVQNETIDTMTQYAVEGSTMIQNIAMQEKLTGENVFPNPISNVNNCYVVDKDADDQYIIRRTEQGDVTYDLLNRDLYRTEAVVEEEAESPYFRIFCIESYDITDTYAIVKIVVGQSEVNPVTSNGQSITKGYSVKDYTYFTVVNL